MAGHSRAELKQLTARVREVYRQLAALPIERQCQGLAQCCHFRLTGRTPNLTWPEAIVAARAARATGRKSIPPTGPDGACPLLKDGACLVYQDRPFGCRTHFCKTAGGPYSREEVRHLIQQLESLALEYGHREARNLHTALATAWDVVA